MLVRRLHNGVPPGVSGEPKQRRAHTVYCQNARLTICEWIPRLVDNGQTVARHRSARAACPDRMLQTVMVEQHHRDLCLTILIMQSAPEFLVEPSHNLGVQMLARA